MPAAFDVDAVEPTVESITIEAVGNRRVLIPHLGAYRDIGFAGSPRAIVVIDSTEPDYEFMKEWAERTSDVSIKGVKAAVFVCPLCELPLDDRDALAEHSFTVHVDNGETESTTVQKASGSTRTPKPKE